MAKRANRSGRDLADQIRILIGLPVPDVVGSPEYQRMFLGVWRQLDAAPDICNIRLQIRFFSAAKLAFQAAGRSDTALDALERIFAIDPTCAGVNRVDSMIDLLRYSINTARNWPKGQHWLSNLSECTFARDRQYWRFCGLVDEMLSDDELSDMPDSLRHELEAELFRRLRQIARKINDGT